MQNYQTIVIGAGPAGASAAIYLARFCHEVLVIDAAEEVHGRTAMATSLRNFLGHTLKTPGADFLGRVKTQLDEYKIPIKNEKVIKATKADNLFQIETENHQTYQATYLVIAVGVGDTMPEIDGLDPYYDTGIFHCLTCDWYDHNGQKAVIVANDDRGITTALMLDALHRPPSLAVVPSKTASYSEAMLQRAKAKDIAVYTSPLTSLEGKLGNLSSITLADGRKVPAEVLFTKLGHTRLDTFLDAGGITLDREKEEGFIKINWQTFESSEPNLFAVGPCNEGPDQAIIAGGQGAMAALEIHSRILQAIGI